MRAREMRVREVEEERCEDVGSSHNAPRQRDLR